MFKSKTHVIYTNVFITYSLAQRWPKIVLVSLNGHSFRNKMVTLYGWNELKSLSSMTILFSAHHNQKKKSLSIQIILKCMLTLV